MAYRLVITPSGVGELNEVSIDPDERVGQNQVEVLNDEPETVADGTYQNNES